MEEIVIKYKEIPIDLVVSELFNILRLIGYMFFYYLLLAVNFELLLIVKKLKQNNRKISVEK